MLKGIGGLVFDHIRQLSLERSVRGNPLWAKNAGNHGNKKETERKKMST